MRCKKSLFKGKRGLSTVVSTILMIMVVMVGMTVLFAFLTTYAQGYQEGTGKSVMESMTVEDAWFKSDGSLYLWVYNIGGVDFKINSVYVNGSRVIPIMWNSSGTLLSSNTPINVGEHIQIRVTSWTSGGTYAVKIVTARGTSFQQTYTQGN